ADVTPLHARLRALAETPCLGPRPPPPWLAAAPDARQPTLALALRTWWKQFGDHAAEYALSPPERWAERVFVGPSLRHAYALEAHRHDALAPLLCPAREPGCGAEAAGYVEDIDRSLERVALRNTLMMGQGSTIKGHDECVAEAKADPAPGARRGRYAACVQKLLPRQARMPLGRLRAPTGWLVVRGRRGHYGFCDELRAYHLGSGAAYVARRCSELVLSGVSVDEGATSARAKLAVEAGTVSVSALRRLGLLLAFGDRLDPEVLDGALSYEVPKDLPPAEPGAFTPDPPPAEGYSHSGQTSLAFRLFAGERGALAEGEFLWPDAYPPFDQAAIDLLVSAEASFQPGCVTAPLPPRLDLAGPLGEVSPLDASPGPLARAHDDLAAALDGLRRKPPARCRSGAPPFLLSNRLPEVRNMFDMV
ncbi:MAG TPA: hypothetical protein VFS00_02360, partial [Polyangiaceae bacterium]|nr:hypothetical protein [Polyangiaceae bacterium]